MKRKRSKLKKILKFIILCMIVFISYTSISSYRSYDMSSISFSSETVEYDKLKHSIKIDGDLPDGVSVSYTYDGISSGGETNVGEYTVVASFTGNSWHSAIDDMTATLTIEAISLADVLSLNDETVTYDGTEQSLEVDGSIPAGVSVSYTYDGADVTGETNAGEYDVIATITNTSSNYLESSLTLEATFKISKAELDLDSVTFNDKYVEYDGDSHSLTAKNIPDDVSVSYTYNGKSVSSVTDAGTYTVKAIFTEDNYITKTLTATLEIIDSSDYSFTIDNGSAILDSYSGSDTEIEIPDLVIKNGKVYSVVELDDECFEDNTKIKSVTIPDCVTSIGSSCFQGCTNLETITIPGEITSLESKCFYECSSLETIEIPSSVTTIDSYCFCECTSLASVTFESESSLESIGADCFCQCKSLESIDLPSSVIIIDDYCFYNCISLASIEIPNSVTSLGVSCFNKCTSLESVTFASESSLESIENHCFYKCISLVSIEIPSSVDSIGNYCFYGCTDLTKVTFDDTTTWYVSKTKGADDNCVSVTNSKTNEYYFTDEYVSYYWTKE